MKIELKHIVGYLPYGLKVRYEGIIIEVEGIIHNDIYNSDTGEIPLHSIKPILTRIKDMNSDQLDEQYTINRFHIVDLTIALSEFFYSNHIDIHNLIEVGLAVDVKTLTK